MLQFVREIPLRIVIQEASSERRGFLFYVSAGFSKEMNPLTGMSANLVLIDQWLADLKADLEKKCFGLKSESLNQVCAEILASARLNLSNRAQSDGAQLMSLEFREHRGWAFSWRVPQGVEEMTLKHFYYHEAFLADLAKFELLKIELQWRWLVGCDFEFASLGEILLKDLKACNLEELCRKLSQLKGHKLESGSLLDTVTVHILSQNFEVTV